MLAGIIGVVIPAVPGIPLMALIAILYKIFTHGVSNWTLVFLLIITAISILVDYSSGLLGAKFGGANGKSILIGILGTILFIPILPPFGPMIGLFVGVAAGEFIFKKDARKALKAASSSTGSIFLGMVLNLILAFGFLIIFIVNGIANL